MSGRRDREAIREFLETLGDSLACVAAHPLIAIRSRGDDGLKQVVLQQPAVLETTNDGRYHLDILHTFSVIDADPPDNGRRVTSQEYIYDLRNDADDATLLSYHWHPRGSSPVTHHHLHVNVDGALIGSRPLDRVHLPTARVALEDLLLFSILDLGVQPRNTEWQEILEGNRSAFRRSQRRGADR